MRIKAGGTPQVCMLQKIVRDAIGVDVVIGEGDGKPVDFIIKTSFTDTDKERQLFALLDRYKLAGKSYSYQNESVTYTLDWSEYVCEKASITITWANYVCELQGTPLCIIYVTAQSDTVYLIKPQYAPASNLNVKLEVDGYDHPSGDPFHYERSVTLHKGSTDEVRLPWDCFLPAGFASVDITEDGTYNYKVLWR